MAIPKPLTELTAVNQMLGLLGERGIDSLADPHPLIPDARAALNDALVEVQSELWWFNVEYPQLIPQYGTGYILVPNDTAAADSLTEHPRLTVRGDRLYNLDDGTDVFTDPIRVRLHRLIPFDDCPPSVRQYVCTKAKFQFTLDKDGDPTKTSILQETARMDYMRMHSEHIRAAKASLLYRPSMQRRIAFVVGGRHGWGFSGPSINSF